jgi:transcriptional regulator GlxA family with amidase domain
MSAGDLICVPGIDFKSFLAGESDLAIKAMRSWFWCQRARGVLIASICSGTLILAKMGLLDGVSCTSHWKCIPYIKSNFPRTRVLDNRLYVFERDIFTSAGMTAGIDMTLALVERWQNPLLAARVAQEMVINVRRAETKEQRNVFLDFQNHFNAEVYRAQEILADRLEVSFTIDDLAKMLNISTRHLARLFKKHTGQTLQAYRDRQRFDHAEQLLQNSEMSVKEVAVACGFSNARQFSRLWARHHGGTPGQRRAVTIMERVSSK